MDAFKVILRSDNPNRAVYPDIRLDAQNGEDVRIFRVARTIKREKKAVKPKEWYFTLGPKIDRLDEKQLDRLEGYIDGMAGEE